MIKVHAIECWADRVLRMELDLPAGSTLRDALMQLEQQGFQPWLERLAQHSQAHWIKGEIGINGHRTRLDQPLNDQDRIEFYRPLVVDIKQARMKLVEAQRRQQVSGKGSRKWKPK